MVLIAVQPLHVAAWIEQLGRELAPPSVKQQLAAARGKTPVLAPAEARALLDRIDVASDAGLRDRALIGLMVYSFARIGAALAMRTQDVFMQDRRLWVRLREKGGKRHEMPCHHNLEYYLLAYIDGCGLRGAPKAPLFRTIARETKRLGESPCPRPARSRWCGAAPARPELRPRSATTRSARPGSPPISKMEEPLKPPPAWRAMPQPAPLSSTTAAAMRSHSMRSSGC